VVDKRVSFAALSAEITSHFIVEDCNLERLNCSVGSDVHFVLAHHCNLDVAAAFAHVLPVL
jgi:hypothetical protein